MHPAALLLLLPGLVAGFTIPADQPDGVYIVNFSNDGEAIHTLIGPPLNQTEVAQLAARAAAPRKPMTPSRIHVPRAPGIGCGNYDLDHGSTDAAVEALKFQCQPGAINRGMDFYSIAGSTVAYICNYGSNAWACQRSDITNDLQLITNVCGWYRAGWREYWRDGNTGAQTGYENRDANFCGRGIDG
ncbi:uncharacterized protein B0T15DRAFT_513625 [Chaetomium strumarium]|uniref:Ecp2 effector protein domain-containing protein n=1 Tax=Chaetomium strumarium TaxID=1170767 RepID=A0AAJ0GNY3_9PEZI|nr:hypothetical protein B0T15DRAFT_513625 [Chaetomium strumarium]